MEPEKKFGRKKKPKSKKNWTLEKKMGKKAPKKIVVFYGLNQLVVLIVI